MFSWLTESQTHVPSLKNVRPCVTMTKYASRWIAYSADNALILPKEWKPFRILTDKPVYFAPVCPTFEAYHSGVSSFVSYWNMHKPYSL